MVQPQHLPAVCGWICTHLRTLSLPKTLVLIWIIAEGCILEGHEKKKNSVCCPGLLAYAESTTKTPPKCPKCQSQTVVKICRPLSSSDTKTSTAEEIFMFRATVHTNLRDPVDTSSTMTATAEHYSGDQTTASSDASEIEQLEQRNSRSLVLYIAAVSCTMIVLFLATCIAAWIYCKRRNDLRRSQRRNKRSEKQMVNV